MSDVSMMPSPLRRLDVKDLSKGMKSTIPTTMLPIGSFLDIKNFYVTLNGLQRKNAWRLFFRTKTNFAKVPLLYPLETVTDLEGFFDVNNSLQLIAFSTNRMYVNMVGNEFVPIPFGRQRNDITGTGAGVINCAASTFVTDRVRANDYARVTNSLGVITETKILADPTIETQLTVASVPAGTLVSLQVIREFQLDPSEIVDYTFIPKAIVVVDGSRRGVWKYHSPIVAGRTDLSGPVLVDMKVKGSAADIAGGDGGYLLSAKTCHFFNGYLILGNTQENYSDPTANSMLDQKRTLRWSSVTDISEFAIVDYVIFTKEMSEIVKITSSEECPIVFLANGIYFGTPSSLAGLPYLYSKVETGAISAVGKRAMCSVPGGMVFIGQKNIYYMELARQGTRVPVLTPIGNDIYNKSCFMNNGPKSSRAFFSPQQNMLFCSFPAAKQRLGTLFGFAFETKSWSYCDDVGSRFTCANVFPYYLLMRWQDGDTTNWNAYDSFSWFSLKLEDYTSRVFVVDVSGYVYVSDDTYDWDEAPNGALVSPQPFNCVLETGDYDFGSPGVYKILTQILLTVADVATKERTADLNVKIETSTDRGKSWEEKTSVLIENGSFIEDAHFRASGEVIRLRFTFDGNAPLFTMSEFELRYRPAGSFVERGSS